MGSDMRQQCACAVVGTCKIHTLCNTACVRPLEAVVALTDRGENMQSPEHNSLGTADSFQQGKTRAATGSWVCQVAHQPLMRCRHGVFSGIAPAGSTCRSRRQTCPPSCCVTSSCWTLARLSCPALRGRSLMSGRHAGSATPAAQQATPRSVLLARMAESVVGGVRAALRGQSYTRTSYASSAILMVPQATPKGCVILACLGKYGVYNFECSALRGQSWVTRHHVGSAAPVAQQATPRDVCGCAVWLHSCRLGGALTGMLRTPSVWYCCCLCTCWFVLHAPPSPVRLCCRGQLGSLLPPQSLLPPLLQYILFLLLTHHRACLLQEPPNFYPHACLHLALLLLVLLLPPVRQVESATVDVPVCRRKASVQIESNTAAAPDASCRVSATRTAPTSCTASL